MNDVRREEEAHLQEVLSRLDAAVADAEERLRYYEQDIQQQKEYLWGNRDEMDHVEKIAQRDSIQQMVSTGDAALALKQRLLKLRSSPYFGRFDFRRDGEGTPEPVYIGVHHFRDEAEGRTRVYDWRAPIAGVFYDHETGPVEYHAPEGRVTGEVQRKRQFRIRDGAIELLLESAVNVVDDVLQEALSESSDEGMKQIVATIQRDQNAIIRNEEAPVLVIQGVAGSGKTSIALHRIAFLLYRFKDTLSSEDILIISPNRVFADYIANVLPELGEEEVGEIRMEDLAEELLGGDIRFQSFFEQTAALLDKEEEAMRARIARKAAPDFLKALDAYVSHVESERFRAEDAWVKGRLVPSWLLGEIFAKHSALVTRDRIRRTVHEVEDKVREQYYYDMTPEDRTELERTLRGMIRETTLRKRYKQFFDWLGEPELFKSAGQSRLEWADVFPLIYLKMKLERVPSTYRKVKHLLVDEMQDYTPVQYAVLDKLFSCNKTILGDARQSINPYSASSLEQIRAAFTGASCVTLNRSYRSSYEITQFAQRINPNPDLVPIERHGENPEVIRCRSKADELERILAMARDFRASEHNTLGVIARTQKRARELFDALREAGLPARLLSEDTQSYGTGIVVCTAHLAKGLEFDRVLVPDAGDRTYRSAMDRNLLYVACTRAMHRLTLTHTGTVTPLIGSGAAA